MAHLCCSYSGVFRGELLNTKSALCKAWMPMVYRDTWVCHCILNTRSKRWFPNSIMQSKLKTQTLRECFNIKMPAYQHKNIIIKIRWLWAHLMFRIRISYLERWSLNWGGPRTLMSSCWFAYSPNFGTSFHGEMYNITPFRCKAWLEH